MCKADTGCHLCLGQGYIAGNRCLCNMGWVSTIKEDEMVKKEYTCKLIQLNSPNYRYKCCMFRNCYILSENMPNWFWRTAQYLMFGFRWSKIKEVKDE